MEWASSPSGLEGVQAFDDALQRLLGRWQAQQPAFLFVHFFFWCRGEQVSGDTWLSGRCDECVRDRVREWRRKQVEEPAFLFVHFFFLCQGIEGCRGEQVSGSALC